MEGFKQIILRDRPIILTEALTAQDLLDQSIILTSLKYNQPVNVGISLGDERNYFWVPLENEFELMTLNHIIVESAKRHAEMN